ncbi:MAG: hypothetical protein B6I28_01320, partial [Fusobacteriia bacterium 4572_132]
MKRIKLLLILLIILNISGCIEINDSWIEPNSVYSGEDISINIDIKVNDGKYKIETEFYSDYPTEWTYLNINRIDEVENDTILRQAIGTDNYNFGSHNIKIKYKVYKWKTHSWGSDKWEFQNESEEIVNFIVVNKTGKLKGMYYNGRSFNTFKFFRDDWNIDFDWGQNSPNKKDLEEDRYSVRWEGVIKTKQAGNYNFKTLSDDGVRFWLKEKDEPKINNWTDHSLTENSININLEGDKEYYFKLEYYENEIESQIKLFWTPPQEIESVIPGENIYTKTDLLRINEIYWQGQNEYIEIYNKSDSDINIQGYKIENAGSSPAEFTIDLNTGVNGSSTIVPSKGYLLIQDTGATDWTIGNHGKTNVFTTKIKKLNLSEDGENLVLKNNYNIEIERIDNFGEWFGGIKNSKVSMERFQEEIFPPGINGEEANDEKSWYTNTKIFESQEHTDMYKNISGTPGEINSSLVKIKNLDPFGYDKVLNKLNMTINLEEYTYGGNQHKPTDYIDELQYAISKSPIYDGNNIFKEWTKINIEEDEIYNISLKNNIIQLAAGNYYVHIRMIKGEKYSNIYNSKVLNVAEKINITSIWDTLLSNNSKDYDVTTNGMKLCFKINVEDEEALNDIELFGYRIYINDLPQEWIASDKSLNIEIDQVLTDKYIYKIGVLAKYGEGDYTNEVISDGIKYIDINSKKIRTYKKENGSPILEKEWSNTGEPIDKTIYVEWDPEVSAISYEGGIKKGKKENLIISDSDFAHLEGTNIIINLQSSLGIEYQGEITLFFRYKYGENYYSDIIKYELWIDDDSPDISLVKLNDLRANLTE